MTGYRWLTIAALVLAAPPLRATSPFTSTFTKSGELAFTLNDFTYLDKSAVYGGTFIDIDKTASIGEVDGSEPFAFGADAHGGVVIKAGVHAYTHLDNQLSLAWKQNYSSYVLDAGFHGETVVGTPFVIGNSSSFLGGQKLNTGSGDLKVSLEVESQIAIGAQARGCAFFCVDGDFGIYTGSPPNPVAAYSSRTNEAEFLGTSYHNALPQVFSDPDKIVTAALNRPDLSGSAQGSNPLVVTLDQTTTLASVSVNIAAAVAKAYGIPSDILSGDLLGFNYETLGLTVAAAINMSQQVNVRPLSGINTYHFTAPVEIYNALTDSWTSPRLDVALIPGNELTVRAPGAETLGFVVEHKARFESVVDISFDAVLAATLTVLHIDGYGIDWSLIKEKFNFFDFGLGSLSTQTRTSDFVSTYETPVNLRFAPIDFDNIVDLTGLITVSFLTNFEDPEDTTRTNLFFQVTNYGLTGCNDASQAGCIIDTRYRPYANQTRRVRRLPTAGLADDGLLLASMEDEYVETISANFTRLDEVLGVPVTFDDPELNVQALYDLLARSLPGGVMPDFKLLPHGAPAGTPIPFSQHGSRVFGASSTTPEPSSWALMILGFGFAGLALRRSGQRARSA